MPRSAPCKVQKPITDRVAKDYPGIEFRFVNTDEEPDLARQYNVSSIPCMVILVGGVEKRRLVGVQDYETLSGALARYKNATSE